MSERNGLFFHENSYLEARGETYVFRPSALAPGYEISAAEKERLLDQLPHIARRSAIETILFSIVAIVSLFYEAFSGQRIGSANIWFIFIGLAGVGFLGIYRRDRLVAQVLLGQLPGVPRKRLTTVLSESNPFAGSKATFSSLWLMRSVYVLLLALFDAAMLGLALSSAVSTAILDAGLSAPGNFTSLIGSAAFVGSIICFNALLAVMIVVLTTKLREARRRMGEGGAALLGQS